MKPESKQCVMRSGVKCEGPDCEGCKDQPQPKADPHMDYWKECVESALEEAGIEATSGQITVMADVVSGGYENYGMAFGYYCIPNPLQVENDRLNHKLSIEKSKVMCPACGGRGRFVEYGPSHTYNSECPKCRGEGKIVP